MYQCKFISFCLLLELSKKWAQAYFNTNIYYFSDMHGHTYFLCVINSNLHVHVMIHVS